MFDLGSPLLSAALANAAVAGALAVLVLVASRKIRRPIIVHGLWVLVLAKLMAPPLVHWEILPSWTASTASTASTATSSAITGLDRSSLDRSSGMPWGLPGMAGAQSSAVDPPAVDSAVAPSESTPSESIGTSAVRASAMPSSAPVSWVHGLLWIWWLGCGAVALAVVGRTLAFERLLHQARPAGDTLGDRVDDLARRLGLRAAPEVLLLDRPLPPLLWWPGFRPRIVLPRALVARLDDAEVDGVLAHELAHLARRDHWVRLLETLASIVFWWHPAVWWSRRRLRSAEEQCCDARVLSVLPGHAKAYAKALVETLELTVRPRVGALPAFSSGFETLSDIEGRLTMILKHRTHSPSPSPWTRRWGQLLAVVAGLALVIVPTWAGPPSVDDTNPEQGKVDAHLEALEREEEALARDLEREEHRLTVQIEEMKVEQERHLEEVERLGEEAERLAEDGHPQEAEALRLHMKEQLARHELHRQLLEIERERRTRNLDLERRIRESHIEAERHSVQGDHEAAQRARKYMLEAEKARAEQERSLLDKEKALQERRLTTRQEMLEAQLKSMQARGEVEAAARLEAERARLELERKRTATEYKIRQKEMAFELAQRSLEEKAHQEGAVSDAMRREQEQLRQEVRALEREMIRERVVQQMEEIRLELPERLDEMRRMLEHAGESDSELAARIETMAKDLEAVLDE